MSNYRKEKNLIIINLDGASGDYRLDINSGILYGVKGNPIKTCPKKGEVTDLFKTYGEGRTNLSYMLNHMLRASRYTSEYTQYIKAMSGADKLDALGMDCQCFYTEQYEYVADNIKSFVAWSKSHETHNYSFGEFERWCEFEKVKSSLGSLANQLTPDIYYNIKRELGNLSTERLGVCVYYLVRGKMWEYQGTDSLWRLRNYFEWCDLLEKAPQKVNNFMREYVEVKREYELRKTEFDNKRLAMNYAKHSKAWEFEYGDYVVVIPTCGQDIVDEGVNMHHCVGGYVRTVIEGSTYICFVRHKDTPDKCYLTCQVRTNGEIGQYYLAYDRHISSDEDYAFKSAFANHLREVWGE
jgi:hypothetical protein